MSYSFAQLRDMPTPHLRVLQFAYFCMTFQRRIDDPGVGSMFLQLRDIVHILSMRNERVFGPDCLLNVQSDPRWKLADNRRQASNDI